MQIFLRTHLCSPWPSCSPQWPSGHPALLCPGADAPPATDLPGELSSGARGSLGSLNAGRTHVLGSLRDLPVQNPAKQDGSLPWGGFCWCGRHGGGGAGHKVGQGQRAGSSPEVPTRQGRARCPRPAGSPQELAGERCWGFPASRLWAALALQGSSPSSRKPARPGCKSRGIRCHPPPVISASRWAIPTSSGMLPT